MHYTQCMPSSLRRLVRKVRASASRAAGGSVLGIDIGASSAKIVQLSKRDGRPTLDTYGEIDLAPYDHAVPGIATSLDPERAAGALQDLLHSIDAPARRGGIALPLSASFIVSAKLPKRDSAQMRTIVPVEAKHYIPVPLDDLTLDWYAVPDMRRHSKIDQPNLTAGTEEVTVLLAAVRNDAVRAARATADRANIEPDFYEIEMFSCVRASPHPQDASSLVVDLGAASTRIYTVSDRGIGMAAHIVARGGQAVTEAVMQACGCDFRGAELLKRTRGLTAAPDYTQHEHETLANAIKSILADTSAEIARVIAEHKKDYGEDITHVSLSGGGSRMAGIAEYFAHQTGVEVVVARPFDLVRTPFVLEDSLHADGPSYAVALGLALRSLR